MSIPPLIGDGMVSMALQLVGCATVGLLLIVLSAAYLALGTAGGRKILGSLLRGEKPTLPDDLG